MKIHLIEDDQALQAALKKALQQAGYVVDASFSGQSAIEKITASIPDIVILDLGLPDIDGVDLLRKIRKIQKKLPVLILTARDTVFEKVRALDSGANDYLAKPFEMEELLARLRVLARQLGNSETSEIIFGEVKLDLANHHVSISDSDIQLSRREFMLLKALMENMGRIQTKETLENKLYSWGEEVMSNAIEVHVSNLRKKLPKNLIQTVRGVGYIIQKPTH